MNPESWVGHTSAIELWVAEILVSGILRDGKGGGRGRCARSGDRDLWRRRSNVRIPEPTSILAGN